MPVYPSEFAAPEPAPRGRGSGRPDAEAARASGRPAWLKPVLLAAWFAASFGFCFFARDLDLMLAGWPFNYWMAAQGALLVFLAIVVAYAFVMNRAERRMAQGSDPLLRHDD